MSTRRSRPLPTVLAAAVLAGVAACSSGASNGSNGSDGTGGSGGGTSAPRSTGSGAASGAPTGSGTAAPSSTADATGGSGASARSGSATRPRTPAATGSGSTGHAAVDTPTDPPSKRSDGRQSAVLRALPGTGSGCVDVGDGTDVRAGSFAAGNFTVARSQFTSQAKSSGAPVVRLYAIPAHAKRMSGITVTATPLTGPGSTQKVSSSSIGTANTWTYYNVDLPVDAAGRWRLRMSAGQDSGCFVVRFG